MDLFNYNYDKEGNNQLKIRKVKIINKYETDYNLKNYNPVQIPIIQRQYWGN